MENRTQTMTLTKSSLVTLVALLAIATVAPLARNQFVTGSIVNATLIIAAATLGIWEGLLVGILPSSIALATGLLPAALAPMIPFVIVGNAILVVTFGGMGKKNYWLGVIPGVFFKFVFLAATSSVVAGLILNDRVATSAAAMMSWPQLATAITGAVIAFGFLKIKEKTEARS